MLGLTLTNRSFTHELRRSLRGCRPKLSLKLCLFEEGYSLYLFGYFIPLLFLDRWRYEPDEIMESWGATFSERTIHLNWGSRYKIVRMPWDWDHLKHEVLRADDTWVPYIGTYEKDKEPDGRHVETFPYHYMLDNGEVQHRTATVFVERHEWRWRSLMWCPWPAIRRQSIAITFSDEVGECTGSWKGGVIGTGYEMRPNETPRETLRRMQRERRFE